MKVRIKYKCRLCGTVSNSDEGINIAVDGGRTAKQFLQDFRPPHLTLVHACSNVLAGIADFAGVEFSEE